MISAITEKLTTEDKKRDELGCQCPYQRKVFLMVSRGLTLTNLEERCYRQDCSPECPNKETSIRDYLTENYFRA